MKVELLQIMVYVELCSFSEELLQKYFYPLPFRLHSNAICFGISVVPFYCCCY